MAGKLRLYHFISSTRAEGPGLRAGLWVQGCPRHCKGCAATATWDFEAGYEESIDNLTNKILSIPELDGITIAGGEPFCQAAALAELLGKLKERRPDFSSICFSGWRLAELKELNLKGINDLLAKTDLLIDGPYIESLASTARPLVGSSNQEFHFLTSRLERWKDTWENTINKLEIRVMPDGRIAANGMIPGEILERLLTLDYKKGDNQDGKVLRELWH